MPRVSIDLMHRETSGNEPFFDRLVKAFHSEARQRHPRWLIVPKMVYGVALCALPATFAKYYMLIEASARRNHKKSLREGCVFRQIQFNDHLDDIREIRMSADVRQHRLMPKEYLAGVVQACQDPPTRSTIHDYPYFGVFQGTKLVGYASCFLAGEACMIEHILGHAGYLPLGVVPQLIIGVANRLFENHSLVKYYGYGTYFGAGETLQRFKRKFGFDPCRVDWWLDRPAAPQSMIQTNSPAEVAKP